MINLHIPLGGFELHSPIGVGGMGAVWRGVHTASGTPVAIKVVTSVRARDPKYVAAFRSEVRSVAAMNHPGIIQLFDFGEVDERAARAPGGGLFLGSPYLVMELASNGSLERLIDSEETDLGWPELREILFSLLYALAHAHARGLIHRDLKPRNVLFCGDGDEPPQLKLTDFGIAFTVEQFEKGETTGAIIGTPFYMAPEQLRGHFRDFGPWTDLYALGCLAFELATGRPAFAADSPIAVCYAHLNHEPSPFQPRMDVPAGVGGWLERLIARDFRDRFQHAADAARALATLERRTEAAMDWREVEPEARSAKLGSLGLGLYGLRAIPLVDREAERELLWKALSSAHRRGRASLVVLDGPAGSGKSHLARWLCERSSEIGVATQLSAFHSHLGSPADGIEPMCARHLRVVGLPLERAHERVESLLRASGMEDTSEWMSLAALVAPASPAEEAAGAPSIRFEGPVERYVLVWRHLQRLCSRGPVILWIDDAQWGRDALRFIEYLLGLQQQSPAPILILVTVRDAALDDRPAEAELISRLLQREESTRLPIEALPPEFRLTLVRSLLGLEPRLAAEVAERTEGNPLFIVQLIGDLVARELLELGEDGFRLTDGASLQLPDSLHQVWAIRIERLLGDRLDDDGIALEIAAVLGRDVNPVEWSQACRWAGVQPPETLVEEMLDSRMARSGAEGLREGWSFFHGMLQESIERRAREAGRLPQHHRTCARMLEGRADPAAAGRLGRHLLAAGEFGAALGPLGTGAEWFIERDELHVAEILIDDRQRALESLSAADSDENWGIQWNLRSQLCLRLGDFGGADHWAGRAQERARQQDWRGIQGWALFHQACSLFERGELTRGLARAGSARKLAASARDAKLMGFCSSKMGALLSRGGNRKQAVGLLLEALSSLQLAGHKVGIGDCMLELAYAAMGAGQLRRARRLIGDAVLHVRESGSRSAMAKCLNFQGEIARLDGELDQAEAFYRESRDIHLAISSERAFLPTANMGLVFLAQRRFAEARQHLEDAITQVSALQHQGYAAIFRAGLLPCHAGEQHWEEFDEQLAETVRLLEETNWVDPDTAPMAERAGDLALEAGHHERALAAYGLAKTQWQRLDRDDQVGLVAAKIESIRG